MRRRHLLWFIAVFALEACTPFTGRSDRPVQRIYLLEGAEYVPALQDVPGCHVVMINSPRAVPGFATSGFAYRRADARIHYFAYHRWSDSPARMLHPLLVRAAERSNVFGGVITPGAPVPGDVRLDTEITDLSQHFEDAQSQVHFAIRVRLYSQERLLGGQVFEVFEPAEANPQSGIEAASRASAKVLEQVLRFTREVLQTSRPRCTSTGP